MKIVLPPEIADLSVIASVSGGKDSTALLLALRESEIPHRAVFADTEWEATETYEYLDLLRDRLGMTIDVVGRPGGMRGRVLHRAGFSARMQRWCTRELKIEPLRKYHDAVEAETGEETVCAMGIRASESESRSKMKVLDDEPKGARTWGGWVWRPLLSWSIADVLAIHHRHGIPVNPLYQKGHSRVGCYPCIFAQKEEIRLVSENAPGRIDEIRALEADVIRIRADRNVEQPGRYKHEVGTYFQGVTDRSGFVPIDDVVQWSRTAHGGRQFQLLMPPPSGGCLRWGMCDPPAEGEK